VVTRKKPTIARPAPGYDAVLTDVVRLVEAARRGAARSVNAIMTATYWAIGRRIVEQEQHGVLRAGYGEELIERLSRDLTTRVGRGFGRRNLFQMRAFYLAYRDIVQIPSARSRSAAAPEKVQTPSALSDAAVVHSAFPLPWSHYVRLLSVQNHEARRFYEEEALRGGGTREGQHREQRDEEPQPAACAAIHTYLPLSIPRLSIASRARACCAPRSTSGRGGARRSRVRGARDRARPVSWVIRLTIPGGPVVPAER